MGAHAALLAVTLLGCHGATRGPVRDSLVGLTLPLLPSPSLTLALPGDVGGRPAVVLLDTLAAIPRVTTGCFDEPLISGARATLADPLGKDETRPVTRVETFSLGGERLRTFGAALNDGTACEVVLGGDVLAGVAFEVDALQRLVRFVPTRSKEEWGRQASAADGGVWTLVPLTRHPRTDWPLLAVRLSQGSATLTAPMALASASHRSSLLDGPAREAGLRTAAELLHDVPEAELPADGRTGLDAFVAPMVELLPGFAGPAARFLPVAGPAPHEVLGLLGVDAWPQGDVTVDLTAGVFAVRRPLMREESGRLRCGQGSPLAAEACFELASRATAGGLLVSARAWTPEPGGATAWLELDGVSSRECRVAVNLPPHAEGLSTQHLVPWPTLARALPGCALKLQAAKTARFSTLDEGFAPCPQLGLFVAEPGQPRLSCQGGRSLGGSSSVGDARLLELLARALHEAPPSPEVEPADPE